MSELGSIAITVATVVVLTYLWGAPRPAIVGRLARRLNRWPWPLVLGVATVGMALLFRVLAANYGEAQLAVDAAAFDLLVPDGEQTAYTLTAVFDLFFAAVYGLFALSLAPTLRSWGGNYRRVGSIACGLVFLAALLDLAENIVLLDLVAQVPGVSGDDVALMTDIGSVKWSFVYLGGALALAVGLTRWLWSTHHKETKAWLAKSRGPYGVYLGLLVGFVLAASFHQRWAFIVLVPAMLVCGSWLNDKVWESRRATDGVDYSTARVRLAVAQLGVGAVLCAGGFRGGGIVGDTAAFLGLALVVMALGALVSELRSRAEATVLWLGLPFALAFVLLAVAAVAPSTFLLVVSFVGAVIAGEIATEIGSEVYLRHIPKGSWRWLPALVAFVAVGVASAALVRQGADPWHITGLVLALAVIVLLATADGDALVVVALLAVALVASTRPGDAAPPESALPVPGEPYILVLGDSYMSGEGALEYLPGTNEVVHTRGEDDPYTNDCRQAPTAWTFQLVEQVAAATENAPALPTRLLFLACSGAVSENIATGPRLDADDDQQGPDELALYEEQEAALGGPPALVIVGIGGNDGGFGDLGTTCVGPGNCAEIADVFFTDRRLVDRDDDGELDDPDHPDRDGDGYADEPREGWPEALSQIRDDLHDSYAAIHDAVGEDVPIVATAYPRPIATRGQRCAGTLLEPDERAFLNNFADELNQTISEQADADEVYFMDLSAALERRGVQLCATGPGSAGLNFLAFGSKGGSLVDSLNPKNWTHNSLHPTEGGHRALAEEAYDCFGAILPELTMPYDGPAAPCPGSEHPGPVDLAVTPCDSERETCSIEGSAWTKVAAVHLLRQAILPLIVLMLALWALFLPFVAIGRDRTDLGLRKFSLIKRWREI